MEKIIQALRQEENIAALFQSVDKGATPVLLSGLDLIHKAHVAAALRKEYHKPLLVICKDETAMQRMAEDLSAMAEEAVDILPTRDLAFHHIENVSRQWEHRRITALHNMLTHRGITLTTAEALMLRTMPRSLFESLGFVLKVEGKYNTIKLAEQLVSLGYRRYLQVEGEGQFSLRGGILDIFSPGAKHPVRIEFFGDEIDTLAYFDKDSQRRIENIKQLTCIPNMEALPAMAEGGREGLACQLRGLREDCESSELAAVLARDIERLENDGIFASVDKYLPLIYTAFETAVDYLPRDTMVVFCDSDAVHQNAEQYVQRTFEDVKSLLERGVISGHNTEFILDSASLYNKLCHFPVVRLDNFVSRVPGLEPKAMHSLTAKELSAYEGNLETALEDIYYYKQQNYAILILCPNDLRRKNLQALFMEKGISAKLSAKQPKYGEVLILEGSQSRSVEYPSIKLVILSEGQLASQKPKKKKVKNKDRLKSYADLTVGDIVVHEHHGIGRFVGMERIVTGQNQRDYIKIAFAGTDFLYVPATNLDLVSKYIGSGGEDKSVRISKLGGATWQATKIKAKAAAKDLAKGLIALYAQRSKEEGFAFPPDDSWQNDFEKGFEYEETDDQLRSTAEIKEDMQSIRPMDRLLCGDVGFGKTEVALRGVMKCVLSSKQAAILVPTTVLARQHYLTAISRFAGFPIKIEMISRFKNPQEQKVIMSKLEAGSIDLIIGTHKLFNKAMKFKDLGLLVIDEEQRFGVTHKEKLKELTKNVDVLTLSATPIPRTLNMALSGVRDMSVLEEAPAERYPVQTYVLEYDRFVVIDALKREFGRGGQSFYVHNNTESIDRIAAKIREDIPEAVVAVAHGKMGQRELGNIMTKMTEGEIDILVCTTIIETGIDIPNANTLIIEQADHMGLSQLHQLRGRVGRSNRHAYAYFTYRTGKVLSEISAKRLAAIREFTEFGSGFKIAMRDLEIRGAGNILGPEQSGHMMNIGYDLYLKILEEAVLEERGEPTRKRTECTAELSVNANIPQSYVEDTGSRIDLYRRIAIIDSAERLEDMLDELIDRFGDVPDSVHNLCLVAKVRNLAAAQGICEISGKEERLLLTWEQGDFKRLSLLCSSPEYKGRLLLNAGERPYVSLRMKAGEKVLSAAEDLVLKYASYAEEKTEEN